MDEILKYFPDLTDIQKEQFQKLDALYHDWNEKINVIFRKDIDSLYTKHVLHSLGIAKIMKFEPGTYVLDVGTGRFSIMFYTIHTPIFRDMTKI